MMDPMGASAVMDFFKERMGDVMEDCHIDTYENGLRKKKLETVWFKVPRKNLREAVKLVAKLQNPPHIAVASGADIGDDIEVIYHFQVFWGYGRNTTVSVSIGTKCPKTDPRLPSISDIVPGAVITEREKQEFLGVTIEGIPDPRRLFLVDNVPEGKYPWRRDESGVEDMMRDVHGGEK